MKKTILTTAIILALLMSCKETKNKNEKTEAVEVTEAAHEHHGEEIATETHAMDNAWTKKIKLDDGSKWNANVETTEGVDKMLGFIKSSDPKTVEDYHALALELDKKKNVVVQKCTMKGPSHDNLHVLLLPLMEKIAALGTITTVEQGSEVTASIKENLDGYYNYFK